MDTKLLKQKILDLAIHGKLVPQNPNDEPASKLLEKIREEKQKLIAEKKIKTDKNDSYIYVGDDNRHYEKFADGTLKDIEDEIPFEVPEGWAWCRLGQIVDVLDSKRKPITKSDRISGPYPYYGATCIQDYINDYIFDEDLLLLGEDGAKWESGEISAFCISGKTWVNNHAHVLRTLCGINRYYLCNVLNYMNLIPYITGTTVPKLNQEKMASITIPLPPSDVQNKIVYEVEKNFGLIDSIENDKSDLQTVIKQTKSKILDLAIHGKLVPQNPSDEPASVLLEKLRAEKDAKIKAGELKRDKNDSYIYKSTTDNCYYQKFADGTVKDIEDEISFNIPNNWNWCLGIEIFNPMKSRKPTGDTFRYIDIETIDNKNHKVVKPKVLSVSDAPSRASREVSTGDVLFSLVRPYLENIALINEENQDCIASTGFFVCKPNEVINPNYLFFLMTSNYVVQGLNQFMKGDNSPSINGDDITKWLYPIPPLAEQKRIVEKIENAFSKLDQIAKQLA